MDDGEAAGGEPQEPKDGEKDQASAVPDKKEPCEEMEEEDGEPVGGEVQEPKDCVKDQASPVPDKKEPCEEMEEEDGEPEEEDGEPEMEEEEEEDGETPAAPTANKEPAAADKGIRSIAGFPGLFDYPVLPTPLITFGPTRELRPPNNGQRRADRKLRNKKVKKSLHAAASTPSSSPSSMNYKAEAEDKDKEQVCRVWSCACVYACAQHKICSGYAIFRKYT